MLLLWSCLCLSIIAYANANSAKENLRVVPGPAPFFQEEAALGRWYVQYRLAGCNFESSDRIDDYTQVLVRGGGGLLSYESWRNDGMCNTLTSRRIRQMQPGVYIIKDPIGAVWSSTGIYVAIDPKQYKILWACTRMSSVRNTCDDPFLNVYTRSPRPGPRTLSEINAALRKIFGISIRSLPRTIHRWPCQGYGGRGGKKL